MKVLDKIRNPERTYFSFELLPPLKGNHIQVIYDAIDPLIEFDPININVTYHQSEVAYKHLPGGLLEKRIIRKRPGTIGIAAAIMNRYPVPVVPHIICGGFTREDTEDALIDLHFLGIQNILALRGDPQKGERNFIPEPGGHAHTAELVKQITDMNRGKYLDDQLQNMDPTDFCVGVAGYPEKHFEAPNLQADLRYLKEKVDAGAHYIVTQLFFDNRKFFAFVDACREIGIEVPIIPGIKPVNTIKDVMLLPQVFHVDIPDDLVQAVQKCKTNTEAKEVGIEFCIRQSQELVKAGVPVIHYYTIGVSDNIRKIARAVF
jgi:methylenetetrahydrofolate reductase (NADPH)